MTSHLATLFKRWLLTQIKEYKESRKFPKRKSFRYLKEIGTLGTSTLVISFVYLLVACIISGVFCALALRVSLWFLILLLPIYLYISISLYRAKVFKAIGNVSTSNSIIQGLFRIKGWSKSSLLIFISTPIRDKQFFFFLKKVSIKA